MAEIEGFSGVVTITRDGRPVSTTTGGGYTPTTPFQIASVSKNFAATLTMMLVERGALDLHEPVTRWLPEAPGSWRDLTLHHFLSNSSGIGHWPEIPMDPAKPATRDERLAAIVGAPRKFDPGTRFLYSSPGYLVVGVVAERAAGMAYPELLAENILRPLGLAATGSGRPQGVAPGHHAGTPIEPWDLGSMIGSGDLWSTVADLHVYAKALDEGALVSPASLARMRTQHIPFAESDGTPDGGLVVTGYGYGHFIGTFNGQPAVLHTGDNPGYRSLLGWLGDLRIVALANEDTVAWEDILARLLP